ncbi:MAG TPA: sugar phosphate isomerase/epimerase family protein [bacterium]|nr:sugar phosphate isomerase/epimerase family protein [bacterium]HON06367.1 sugar phosphate isomerase/epimerase family protein [bacterium]HQL64414.1 sugar phosphate isomerase/epimerase family protein [bacterium]
MKKTKLGIIVGSGENLDQTFQKVKMFNFPLCQMGFIAENMAMFDPVRIKQKADEYSVEIFSVFLLFNGQVFNLKDGPATMGFVAPAFRKERLKLALEFSDFVKEMQTEFIVSHVGFIPDDEQDPVYQSFIPVIKEFIEKCRKNGQFFCFETGQELPSTLKRTIIDIGLDNVGINLDPANLILYGKANPIDAVEIFGKYIRSIHGKDALWPNRDEYLGKEVPVGDGIVNFPLLLRRLKNLGFNGPIIIEREISGEKQIQDIKRAIEFFSKII